MLLGQPDKYVFGSFMKTAVHSAADKNLFSEAMRLKRIIKRVNKPDWPCYHGDLRLFGPQNRGHQI